MRHEDPMLAEPDVETIEQCQLADALGAPCGTPWPELLERVRELAGTSTEATARERWASWRHLRGPGVTEAVS